MKIRKVRKIKLIKEIPLHLATPQEVKIKYSKNSFMYVHPNRVYLKCRTVDFLIEENLRIQKNKDMFFVS